MENSDEIVELCELSPGFTLFIDGESFVLKVDRINHNKNYYYSWIGDAIKAFIVLSLREFNKLNQDPKIASLIQSIDDLNLNLSKFNKFNLDDYKKIIDDPVEKDCRSGR